MSPPKIKTAERVAIQLASASSAIPASVQQSTQRLCDDQRTAARRFPLIVDAVARLRSRSCIIDGEAVACDDNGVASFDLIRHHRANQVVFLYAFDLIELNGDDLRHDPFEGRKETLAMILAKAGPGIRFNEHMEGDGEIVFRHACKLGLGCTSFVAPCSANFLVRRICRAGAIRRSIGERPTLGAQRHIEARIGQVLGPPAQRRTDRFTYPRRIQPGNFRRLRENTPSPYREELRAAGQGTDRPKVTAIARSRLLPELMKARSARTKVRDFPQLAPKSLLKSMMLKLRLREIPHPSTPMPRSPTIVTSAANAPSALRRLIHRGALVGLGAAAEVYFSSTVAQPDSEQFRSSPRTSSLLRRIILQRPR
jgi:hypothetical protein